MVGRPFTGTMAEEVWPTIDRNAAGGAPAAKTTATRHVFAALGTRRFVFLTGMILRRRLRPREITISTGYRSGTITCGYFTERSAAFARKFHGQGTCQVARRTHRARQI